MLSFGKTMVTGITAYKRRSPNEKILRIGIDVHRTNCILCAIEPRFKIAGFTVDH